MRRSSPAVRWRRPTSPHISPAPSGRSRTAASWRRSSASCSCTSPAEERAYGASTGHEGGRKRSGGGGRLSAHSAIGGDRRLRRLLWADEADIGAAGVLGPDQDRLLARIADAARRRRQAVVH